MAKDKSVVTVSDGSNSVLSKARKILGDSSNQKREDNEKNKLLKLGNAKSWGKTFNILGDKASKDIETHGDDNNSGSIVVDGGSLSNREGNHTLTDANMGGNSNFSVQESESSRLENNNRRLMANNRKLARLQTKNMIEGIGAIHKAVQEKNAKLMTAQLKSSEGILGEARKANQFRMSVQADYYKNSIDYKKNILSEIQKTNELLRIGFNITKQGKKDEKAQRESFARMLFGPDWKAGLKGGLQGVFTKVIDSSPIDTSTIELIKTLGESMLGDIKRKGVFRSAAGGAIKGLGRKLLGSSNFGFFENLLADPGKIAEAFANRGQLSSNPLFRLLGQVFGTSNKKIDTKFNAAEQYKKTRNINDRSTFDKKAHLALTEVIPQYLAQMTASLTGRKELHYNYNTGKYMTRNEAMKSQKEDGNVAKLRQRSMVNLQSAIDEAREFAKEGSTLKRFLDGMSSKTKNDLTFAVITLFDNMARNGVGVAEVMGIPFDRYDAKTVREMAGGKITLETAFFVGKFMSLMKNESDADIKELWEDLIQEADEFGNAVEKDIKRRTAEIDNNNALVSIYSGGYKEDASVASAIKKAQATGQKNRRKFKEAMDKVAKSDRYDYDTLQEIASQSVDMIDFNLKRLEGMKIEVSDELKAALMSDEILKGKNGLPKTIAKNMLDQVDTLIKRSRENGSEGAFLDYLESKKEKLEELLKEGMSDEVTKSDMKKFVKSGYKYGQKFNGAFDGRRAEDFTNPAALKDMAQLFLTSDEGEKTSKVVQSIGVGALATKVAKMAGIGGIWAPLAGVVTAGMVKADGRLNNLINTIGTNYGDEKLEDGRTRREAALQEVMKSVLPAGFATATGIKVSNFIGANLRFGKILGPVIGFGVGSAIYGISKSGIIKKMLGGLFGWVGKLGKWIDKKFLGGIFSSIGSGFKGMLGEAGSKYLGIGKKRHKIKDLTSGYDKETSKAKYGMDKSNKMLKSLKSAYDSDTTIKSKHPNAFNSDGSVNEASGFSVEDNELYHNGEMILQVSDRRSAKEDRRFGRLDKELYKNANAAMLKELYAKANGKDAEAIRREIQKVVNKRSQYNHEDDDYLSPDEAKDILGGATRSKVKFGGKVDPRLSKAGTCAPAVMSRIMQVFTGKAANPKDFYATANPYIRNKGVSMDYFTSALSKIGGVNVSNIIKNPELHIVEKIKGKKGIIIFHKAKGDGHYILAYDYKGDSITVYDPFDESTNKVHVANPFIGSDFALAAIYEGDNKGLIKLQATVSKIRKDRESAAKDKEFIDKMGFKPAGSSGSSLSFGGISSSGLPSGRNKSNAINVNIVGGHLDAIGVIGAVDADSYRSKMKVLANHTKDSETNMKFNKYKEFFRQDPEARKSDKGQDIQEEREKKNTGYLEEIASGKKDDGKEKKEKKEGWLSKIMKSLPLVIPGAIALFGWLKKVGPRGVITALAKGVVAGVKFAFKGIGKVLGWIKKLLGKVFGFKETAKDAGKELLEETAENAVTATGKEVAEEATESAVKSVGKEVAEEAVEGAAKSGGGVIANGIKKLVQKLGSSIAKIGAVLTKMPVVGPLFEKVGGTKFMQKLAEMLPQAAKEVGEEGTEQVAKKSASSGVKGALAGLIGVGTVINIAFTAWDVISALKKAPQTFNLPPEKLTWKHKLAAGGVAGILGLIEAIIPGMGWVLIPVRVFAEGFLIRLMYDFLAGVKDKEEDEKNREIGGGSEAKESQKGKNGKNPNDKDTSADKAAGSEADKKAREEFAKSESQNSFVFNGGAGAFFGYDANGNLVQVNSGDFNKQPAAPADTGTPTDTGGADTSTSSSSSSSGGSKKSSNKSNKLSFSKEDYNMLGELPSVAGGSYNGVPIPSLNSEETKYLEKYFYNHQQHWANLKAAWRKYISSHRSPDALGEVRKWWYSATTGVKREMANDTKAGKNAFINKEIQKYQKGMKSHEREETKAEATAAARAKYNKAYTDAQKKYVGKARGNDARELREEFGGKWNAKMGGRGTGMYYNNGNNKRYSTPFVSQRKFLGNINLGGDNMKSAGCALAVAKMVTRHIGRRVDDMDLYNAAKNFILPDNSISIEFFRDSLGGNLTKSAADAIATLGQKGTAGAFLIEKMGSLHYVAILNDNGKILLGDPESNNYEEISSDFPILNNFRMAALFGGKFQGLGGRFNIGGKGLWDSIKKGASNLWNGIKSGVGAIGKAIGFGQKSDSSSSNKNGESPNLDDNPNAKNLSSGMQNYIGSLYDYTPGVGQEVVSNATSGGNSGSSGGAAETTIKMPHGDVVATRDRKEFGAENTSTVVEYADGTIAIRSGNRGVRNFNPGNTDWGDEWAKKFGLIGNEGGPSGPSQRPKIMNAGGWINRQGVYKNFTSATKALYYKLFEKEGGIGYKNKSIRDAITTYAPPSQNPTEEYIRFVSQATGYPDSKVLKDFEDSKKYAMIDAIMKKEFGGASKEVIQKKFDEIAQKEKIVKQGSGKATAGAGILKVASDILKYSANNIANYSGHWTSEQACGPSLAMILHKVFYPAKDLSGRAKDFLQLAEKYREFGTGFTRNEYFSDGFGGKLLENCTPSMIKSMVLPGCAMVINTKRHFVGVVNTDDAIYKIDPTGDSGRGKIEKLNSSDEIYKDPSFVGIVYTPSSPFLDIDQVLNRRLFDIKKLELTGAGGGYGNLDKNISTVELARINKENNKGRKFTSRVLLPDGKATYEDTYISSYFAKEEGGKGNGKYDYTGVSCALAWGREDGGGSYKVVDPINPPVDSAAYQSAAYIVDLVMGRKTDFYIKDREKADGKKGPTTSGDHCRLYVWEAIEHAHPDIKPKSLGQRHGPEVLNSIPYTRISIKSKPQIGDIIRLDEGKGQHVCMYVGGLGGTVEGHVMVWCSDFLQKGPAASNNSYSHYQNEGCKGMLYRPSDLLGSVGSDYKKAKSTGTGNGSGTNAAVGSGSANGQVGANGPQGAGEKLSLKGASLGGFYDTSTGEYVDVSQYLLKYARKKAQLFGGAQGGATQPVASTNPANTSSSSSASVAGGAVGPLGLSASQDMVKGAPIENGSSSVPESLATKAADYAWAHAKSEGSHSGDCGRFVGTALDAVMPHKMSTNRDACAFFGAKVLSRGKPQGLKTISGLDRQTECVHKDKMEKNGFHVISCASTPQVGDVMCYTSPKRPEHVGHIIILTKNGWCSDIHQYNKWYVYSSYGPQSEIKVTLWRYKEGAGGDEDDPGIVPIKRGAGGKVQDLVESDSLLHNYLQYQKSSAVKVQSSESMFGGYAGRYKGNMAIGGSPYNAPGTSKGMQHPNGFKTLETSVAQLAKAQEENNRIQKEQLEYQKRTAMTNEEIAKKSFGGEEIKAVFSARDNANDMANDFNNLQKKLDSWKASANVTSNLT